MGRIPKPVAPLSHGSPIYPTPAPADYADEVSKEDLDKLAAMIPKGDEEESDEDWELVDGPGW